MSTADELAKLDALKKSGLLTRKAYKAEKAKLLVESLPRLSPARLSPLASSRRRAGDGGRR
jgi:hypothetical protein